jgi:hypothetical protein
MPHATYVYILHTIVHVTFISTLLIFNITFKYNYTVLIHNVKNAYRNKNHKSHGLK